jgi:glycosyltransferase involved in cell wall biosynthesis
MTVPLELSLDVSAVPANPGGAGHYTMALARGLAAHPHVALTLVARRGDTGRWHDLTDGTPCRDAVPRLRPVRLAFEQVGLPKLLRSIGASLHHGPHYTMPERSPIPCAVTIHDCTFFDHPEWHVRSKAAFFRRAIRRAAQRAAVLICVSQTTAERLHASCPVRAPVVVAPHGVDHARFAPDEPAAGADRTALAALGIPDGRPLVVFVGTLEPRKGVASLVAAFDRIASADSDVVLVLGGQPGWRLDATEEALDVARHRDRVVRTGYLPDAAVPALLRCASAVAYPALEEGFGLPALEALACAAPLVTTQGTAMAEFAGDAALLVPQGDVDALADALQKALDEGRSTSRTAHGLAVAAEHTWEATVTRHLHAYDVAESASQ